MNPATTACCEVCESLLTLSPEYRCYQQLEHAALCLAVKGKKTGVTQCVQLKVSLSGMRKKEKERG